MLIQIYTNWSKKGIAFVPNLILPTSLNHSGYNIVNWSMAFFEILPLFKAEYREFN